MQGKNFTSAVVAVVAAVAVGIPASAGTADFSDEPISVPDMNTAPDGLPQLEAVEVTHHEGFDRVVFRFSSHVPGYDVRYVPAVTSDPSDEPVELEGSAFILVALHTVASGQVGAPPAPQDRQTPRFPQLRELAGAGDFEGVVSFGLGLASASGFRVLSMTSPDRVVVEVRIPSLAETGSPTDAIALAAALALLAGVLACAVASRRPRSPA